MDLKTRWNNWLAGAKLTDWLIVFLTLAIAVLAYFQYKELHTGGIDTNRLANYAEASKKSAEDAATAASRSASAAERFSHSAEGINSGVDSAVAKLNVQASQTERLANQALIQSTAAKAAADATRAMAETQKLSLELSERPWIVSNASLASSFTYDINGAHLTLDYVLENTGHTPAVAVMIWPEMYLQGPTKLNLIDERVRFCSNAPSETILGDTIFPQQIIHKRMSFGLSRSELVELSKQPMHDFLAVSVIDCILYRGSSFPDHRFHTSTIYDLFRVGPVPGTFLLETSKDYPIDQLVFSPSMLGGTIAK